MSIEHIRYYDFDSSQELAFFKQQKENLMRTTQVNTQGLNLKNLNNKINQSQNEIEYWFGDQDNFGRIIANTTANANTPFIAPRRRKPITLDAAVEQMAQTMRHLHEGTKTVQKKYEQGYGALIGLYNQVINNKNNIQIAQDEFQTMINKLNPQELVTLGTDNISNHLGYLGELCGLIMLHNYAVEILNDKNFVKQLNPQGNLKVQILNTGGRTGEKSQLDHRQRLQADNMLVISDDRGVIFSTGMSNKMNTTYKANAESTGSSVKFRTTSINSFLQEHPDWADPVYNIFSYHWLDLSAALNTVWSFREDWLQKESGKLGRQMIGAQIMYDYAYGTNSQFNVNNLTLKDKVDLVAYGTTIVASSSMLRQSFFDKNGKLLSNLTHIQTNEKQSRAKWFTPHASDSERPPTTRPSNLSSVLEAQTKINQINLYYYKTYNMNKLL